MNTEVLTKVTIFLFIFGSTAGFFYARRRNCRLIINGRCLDKMPLNSHRALSKLNKRLHVHDKPFNTQRAPRTRHPQCRDTWHYSNLWFNIVLKGRFFKNTKEKGMNSVIDLPTYRGCLPKCHRNLEYVLSNDCTKMWRCKDRKPVRVSRCNPGLIFSKRLLMCTQEGGYFDDCRGIGKLTTQKPKPVTTSIPNYPICRSAFETIISEDCSQLWRCRWGRPVRMPNCRHGGIFSRRLRKCVKKGGRCDDCQESGKLTTQKPTPVSTSIQNYPTCRYAFQTIISEDCSQLWRCRWGRPVRMASCRRGEIFSRRLRKCVKKGGRSDDCQKSETTTIMSSPSTTVAISTVNIPTRTSPSTIKLQNRVTTRSPRPTSSTQNPEYNTVISTTELINYTTDTSEEDKKYTSAPNVYENETVTLIRNSTFLSTNDIRETTTTISITTSMEPEEITTNTDNYTTREQNLSTSSPAPTTLSGLCSADQFSCDDGSCIPITYMCDNYQDCPDAADEDLELCSWTNTCIEGEYLCDDGSCVRGTECNGVEECSDGSDESELKCR